MNKKMKIEFRTIAIGHLVLNYLIFVGLALLAQLMYPGGIYVWFLLLGPVPLYFLNRGKVNLEVKNNKLIIDWSKPPLFRSVPRREIDLDEIIRWKFDKNFRGPDNFILILRNGERLQIRPAMFTLRNLESELFTAFTEQMKAHHADTPKEKLHALILNSEYLKLLNRKLRFLKYGLKAAITAALLMLLIMIFTTKENQNLVSMSFLGFFIISLLAFLYKKYLEREKEQTITLGSVGEAI